MGVEPMKGFYMKRILSFLLAALTAVSLLTACAAAGPGDTARVSVATLTGPTGMGLIKLLGDDSYDVTLLSNPDQISPKIINNEVDAATIPSNLAAVIYNKTKGSIRTIAVNTMGVLYILENGDTVGGIADLAGKTIYATGQGSSPEYVLGKILDANGLKNVTVHFMGSHADLANAMAAGDVKLALLPEPFVSTVLAKNSDVKVKIDINEEWKKIFGEGAGIPMGVTIVSRKFAQNKTAMDKLMADLKASAGYAASDAAAAADIAEAGIVGSKEIAASAIPRCGISFITGAECKAMLEDYFSVMFESDPKSLGGSLPDDDFYYMP